MQNSKYIWHDPSGAGRNVFAVFRRTFDLAARPRAAALHLFADDLYRLFVNGRVLLYGPARFVPSHPEFDTIDLLPYLKTGRNTLLVEAHSRGAECFQAHLTPGGFIADGKVELPDGVQITLCTPGLWEAAACPARDTEAETFSFAQGPVELLDTRKYQPGENHLDWHPAVLIENPSVRGALSPRSIPMPSLELIAPEACHLLATLKPAGLRYGFRAQGADSRASRPRHVGWATHLFSPKAQTIDAGVFWCDPVLNGRRVLTDDCVLRGNHQTVRFELNEGWNFLYGFSGVPQPRWPIMIELPGDSGVTAHAGQNPNEKAAFLIRIIEGNDAAAILKEALPTRCEELPGFPSDWSRAGGVGEYFSPARDMAWDVLDSVVQRDGPVRFPLVLPSNPAQGGGTVVYQFEKEFLGHPVLEIEAPAGTVMDIAYDEKTVGEGVLRLYRSHPFVNNAERFILCGGRQVVETFHERGGRLFQITVRAPSGPVTLHKVAIRSKQVNLRETGFFRCSDELLNKIWRTSVDTLQSSLSDGWIDPWRERGLYLGDVLVESAATRCFASDWRFDPWALRLWARTQYPDGMMPPVTPSAHVEVLADYTLEWILYLWDYWKSSGDTALVEELWPTVDRILHTEAWQTHPSGLWQAPEGVVVFVDWSATEEEKSGAGAALNAFRIHALDCAAEMASAIGREEESVGLSEESERVRRIFREHLWNEDLGRFVPSVSGSSQTRGPSVHANILAVAWKIGSEDERALALRYVKTWMKGNHIGDQPGHVELYFLHFALEALRVASCPGFAEEVLCNHYRIMHEAGAWAWWEVFSKGGDSGIGSNCHGWAATPLVHLARCTLGVDFHAGLDENYLIVRPSSESLEWAEGAVPHPKGTVEVRWRVTDEFLTLDLKVPEGITLQIKPGGRLSRLPRSITVNDKPFPASEAVLGDPVLLAAS